MQGKIIGVSGMDASGKSTISSMLQEILLEKKREFIVTKQPLKVLKQWSVFTDMLENKCDECDFSTIGSLISWGRFNTQLKIIEPALKSGKIIICERYILDIYAWSLFRGAEEAWIDNWTSLLIPENLSLYCDANPQIVFDRLNTRGKSVKKGEDSIESIGKLISLYRRKAEQKGSVFIDTNETSSKIVLNEILIDYGVYEDKTTDL